MDRDVGAVPAAGGRQPGMSRGAILASIGKLTRQSRRSNSSPRTSASAPRGIAYSCSLKRTPSAGGTPEVHDHVLVAGETNFEDSIRRLAATTGELHGSITHVSVIPWTCRRVIGPIRAACTASVPGREY